MIASAQNLWFIEIYDTLAHLKMCHCEDLRNEEAGAAAPQRVQWCHSVRALHGANASNISLKQKLCSLRVFLLQEIHDLKVKASLSMESTRPNFNSETDVCTALNAIKLL